MDNNIRIKISFDPVDVWDEMMFREFIKALVYDTDNYEVFLVTSSTDNTFITNVLTEIDMDVANSNQVSNNTAIVARINTLKSLIHFSADNVLVNLVNSTLPIQLTSNNVTGCQALILNNIVDTFRSQQKYITFFHFWVDQINKKY